MKIYSYLLFFSLLMCSCVSQPKKGSQSLSYLALGDSYTIGESVAVGERWPIQLVNKLNKQNYTIPTPQIIAKTGWRTDNLLSAIKKELSSTAEYDLVSLLIGVNNEFQGKPITEYETELKTLLTKAIKHCKYGKKGVFVLSIPDYGATPYGKPRAAAIGAAIDEWNAVCKAVCEECEVPFYNITDISRKGAKQADLVAEDGLHPSGKMYGLWVDEIVSKIKVLLVEQSLTK